MDQRSAISKINKRGALLVFPVNNSKEPSSLWSEFFPRKKMLWDWDESGSSDVHEMWHLMKALSANRQVVYSKWYQGRATFFSQEVFSSLLCILAPDKNTLSRTSLEILEVLEESSPLSTREVKRLAALQGRDNESAYNRAMKELFSHLHIIGFGEVDDGSFPSLAVGATHLLHEDLWKFGRQMTKQQAWPVIDKYMPVASKMRRFLERLMINKQRLTAPLNVGE